MHTKQEQEIDFDRQCFLITHNHFTVCNLAWQYLSSRQWL